jgi:sugar O-acyltransferase (sialic acid O-acetyltransferase NeuD family)
MRKLIIIGAGDFGREVLDWALAVPAGRRDWEVAGFLDANPSALNNYPCQIGVLGNPATYNPSSRDCFICAIGHPTTKLRVCREIVERGGEFITLVHPTAVVGSHNVIGAGSLLCPGSVITTNVTLGRFVTLNLHATVGHNAVLGEGCTLSPHCDITGRATLGEGVFLGSHASVLPSVQVGDYAVIGAGSVVIRKVAAGATVIGVPAKQVAGFSSSQNQ